MHDAKIEAYIPMGPGPDAIEVIADSEGCQLNIMVDGVCEYRLNVNKFFEIKVVKHPSEDVLYSERLWIK